MGTIKTYQKGDRVWVHVNCWGRPECIRLAEILNSIERRRIPSDEPHLTVRYLDEQEYLAYECIPLSWILKPYEGEATSEQLYKLLID